MYGFKWLIPIEVFYKVVFPKVYFFLTKPYNDRTPSQEQGLTRTLSVHSMVFFVGGKYWNQGSNQSVSEKQLMNTRSLLLLATYSLCKYSKPHSPSKSMNMATIQLPIRNT